MYQRGCKSLGWSIHTPPLKGGLHGQLTPVPNFRRQNIQIISKNTNLGLQELELGARLLYMSTATMIIKTRTTTAMAPHNINLL